MSLAIFVSLVIVATALAIYYVKKKFSYFEERGFLYVKPEFPYGNIKGAGTSFHISQLSEKFYNQFKHEAKAFGLYFFTQPVIFLTDLDVIKNVLIKDFSNFHDRGIYFNKDADPLSAHLFAIEGAEWKHMRAKLSPTFTSGKMKMMFGTVQDIAQEMISYLQENKKAVEELEMNNILARFTTDVIGNVAFGLEMKSNKEADSMFLEMGRKFISPPKAQTMKILFLAMFRNFARRLNLRLTPDDVSEFFLTSIKDTVNYRETNKIVRNDFFNLLLELKNLGKLKDEEGEASEKMTFEELAAQAFLFFLAGFETSSTTMTFALYELALHQDIQDKLRREIKEVLAKHNGQITYDSMMDMKYLHMVIDETLRMYGPVDNLMRTAVNDYKIPGTKLVIEKDTLVFIPAYAIQRDPEIYPEPEKFDPERFTDENKAARHPMTHLPFGAGNRNCIGLRFGYMQSKIGLINLLLNFKFSPSKRTTIPMKFLPNSQVLSPIDRMWLNVEKLSN